MVLFLSLVIASLCGVGIYVIFFDGPKDLVTRFVAYLVGGGGRDFRITLLLSAFVVGGLLGCLLLAHLTGKPLSIPFL